MKLNHKHRHPWALIETAVILSNKNLTYRSISDKINSLGVYVSHKTVFEWVQKFSKHVNTKNGKCNGRFSVEEHDVKCNGTPMFMYVARNTKKSTLGVFFRSKKNIDIAKKHFLNIINKEDSR